MKPEGFLPSWAVSPAYPQWRPVQSIGQLEMLNVLVHSHRCNIWMKFTLSKQSAIVFFLCFLKWKRAQVPCTHTFSEYFQSFKLAVSEVFQPAVQKYWIFAGIIIYNKLHNSRTWAGLVASITSLLWYGLCTKDLQSLHWSISIDPESGKQEYWCEWGCVQDDLYCTCFLSDCLLQLHTMKRGGGKKTIHPSPASNEFLHADSV